MEIVLFITEMIGVAAFAVSGSVTAVRNKLDIFGVLVLGTVTALGGGLIRDILLGHFPPRMFYSYEYLALAAIISTLVFSFFALKRRQRWVKLKAVRKTADRTQKIPETENTLAKKITQEVITIFDSAGLAIFTVVGCGYAIEEGYAGNAFFVVFLGTMTGVGGGVLRDVLSMKIPAVLKKQVYATASIIGGIVYYFAERLINHTAAIVIGAVLIFLIRFAAARFRWDLPRITGKNDYYE